MTRTRSQMDEVVVATAVAREQTAKSSEDADAGREILERISGLIGSSNDTATQIATLARQQLADVQEIDVNLHAITAGSAEIEQQAESVAQAQLDLSASAERASLTLARYDTGGLISRCGSAAKTWPTTCGRSSRRRSTSAGSASAKCSSFATRRRPDR